MVSALLVAGLMLTLLPANIMAAEDVEIEVPANPGMSWEKEATIYFGDNSGSEGSEVSQGDISWYSNNEDGTEYILSDADDLAGLAYLVNAGTEDFKGKTIKLRADIKLQDKSVTILDGNYAVNSNLTLKEWTPIGTSSHPFKGTFDGSKEDGSEENYTISGLAIQSELNNGNSVYLGLFGYCNEDAEIKNVDLKDAYVYGKADNNDTHYYVGGIAGTGGTIDNCSVEGRIVLDISAKGEDLNAGTMVFAVGGITGAASKCVQACEYSGVVLGKSLYMGGILGYGNQVTVKNCANNGTVANQYFNTGHRNLNQGMTGGIAGRLLNSIAVEGCTNQGSVAAAHGYVGGIVAYLHGGTISGCTNTTTVQNTLTYDDCDSGDSIGGIVGSIINGAINGCTNNGTVAAVECCSNIGGIVGMTNFETTKIENCLNTGEIVGFQSINENVECASGGICGNVVQGCTVEKCVNIGRVLSNGQKYNTSGSGGISATCNGTIQQCWNGGAVSGYKNAGGITGAITRNGAQIKNCYNIGNVTSIKNNGYVGGLIGDFYSSGSITTSYNVGDVSVTGGNYVGGVVGHAGSGTVSNCYYLDSSVISGNSNNSGTLLSGFQMTDSNWASNFYGFNSEDTDTWAKNDNNSDTLYLPHLTVLVASEDETTLKAPYSHSLEDSLSYPFVSASSLKIPVIDVKLDASTLTMTVGDKQTLTATVQPNDATNKNVTWSSNDEDVVTVDGNGNITAIGEGTATVTVTTEDGSQTATCIVTVNPAMPSEPEEPTTPSDPPYTGSYNYPVTVTDTDNGSVLLDKADEWVTGGETVTFSIAPDEAYLLESLTITDKNGKEITVKDNGDGRYTFTMPESAVTITATFAEDPDWEPTPEPGDEWPFVDVSEGDWFYDPVAWAYEQGLMTGTSATTFEPNISTTRGMIVAILHRLEDSPVVNYAMTFDDVADGDWYAEAVRWAASEGIVAGYSDAQFGPNDPIIREQMAAILYNYAEWKGYDVSARADLSSYSDQPSAWAVEVMQWAKAEGLINGTTATTLDPQGHATRAQVAAILQRFLEN